MFLFHMCSRAIAIIANNSGMPWLPDVRRTPLGADNFMIPSLVAMLVMFILLRPYLDDLKIDKTDGENETNNADKETNA